MQVLFIHGGGDNAYAIDRDIVSALGTALWNEVTIDYPRVNGLERIDWPATRAELKQVFSRSQEPQVVVAHSIGATAILKLLTTGEPLSISKAFLLAPPYKGEDSHWGIDAFTLPKDFANHLPRELQIAIYHGNEDSIIPVSDARCYRDRMPMATVSVLDGCGHQFDGALDGIAKDLNLALHR